MSVLRRAVRASSAPRQRASEAAVFVAPTAGWISNRALATPSTGAQGATVLDNWFPTATTAIMRRGSQIYAEIGNAVPVRSLFKYVVGNNQKFFGATDEYVYDITNVLTPFSWTLGDDDYEIGEDDYEIGLNAVDPSDAQWAGLGGDWHVVQFATTGGVFLVGVNGASEGFIYDGSDFWPNVAGGVWSLPYDAETAGFEIGEVVTGDESGAKGTVLQVDPARLVLTDIVTTPAQWTLDFENGSGDFVAGATITDAVAQATARIASASSTATWRMFFDFGASDFTIGDTLTGTDSGATAEIEDIEPGDQQWALEVDSGISPFEVDEEVEGETSSATGRVVRIENVRSQWKLKYDGGTVTFPVGAVVLGATSNAKGKVVEVVGTTSAGTLVLEKLVGTFQDNEALTGDLAGNALVNGAQSSIFFAARLILQDVTGSFSNDETVTGSVDGSAIAKGANTGPFDTGTLILSDLVGDFEAGEQITDGSGGDAKAFARQQNPVYSGTLTIEDLIGNFTGGNRITATNGVTADAVSEQIYIGGGNFRDNELISGSLGGGATVNGQMSNVVPGVTFPDGLTSADMAYVWVYKNTLYFVQKDSLTAWYLPVDSIGGEAKPFTLGAEFGQGGSLLIGQSWSMSSSGQGGLSEQNVFLSNEGEVVVYQGSHPDVEWTKVGSYRIGAPRGRRGFIRAGGDLIFATTIGFVALSTAIQVDVAALSPKAVSFSIEDEWNDAILQRGTNWVCCLWAEGHMVAIAPPAGESDPMFLVSNARTGAWAPFTGWNASCMEVFRGQLYFGTPDGFVMQAMVGGTDNGVPFTATYMPLFSDNQKPTMMKAAKMGRVELISATDVQEKLSCRFDFDESLPAPPDSVPVLVGNQWDNAIWNESVWSSSSDTIVTKHRHSISGNGYRIAPVLQITSGSAVPTDVRIVSVDVTYDVGDIFT